MDYHQNARLTVYSRELLAKQLMEQGVTLKLAAASFNVTAKTAAKWVRRYRQAGTAGLCDRSSRPRTLRGPTSIEVIARVESLRRQRWTGFRIVLRQSAYARTYQNSPNENNTSCPGYTNTTRTGHMLVSASRRPSAEQGSIRTTC